MIYTATALAFETTVPHAITPCMTAWPGPCYKPSQLPFNEFCWMVGPTGVPFILSAQLEPHLAWFTLQQCFGDYMIICNDSLYACLARLLLQAVTFALQQVLQDSGQYMCALHSFS